jgi:hypothetical protein
MTCDRFKGMVGYKGQNYAVVADKPDGSESRLGWQNSEDLSAWQSMAKAWGLTNLRLVPMPISEENR